MLRKRSPGSSAILMAKSFTRFGSSAFLSISLAALGLLLYISFIHILLFGSERFFLKGTFPFVSLSQATAFSKIPKMHLKPTEYIGIGLGQATGFLDPKTPGLSEPILGMGFSLGKMPDRRGLEAPIDGNDHPAAKIFHVTKEFGDAQFGGLGAIVTNLAVVQKEQGMDVFVIMPCYSYLEDLYQDSMRYETNVTIYVETRWGGRQELEVPIFWVQYEGVTVFLVGAPSSGDYQHVFHAIGNLHIYSFTDIRPNERDLFFSAVSAKFLAQYHRWQGISYIQVHGSTNAILMEFWKREKVETHLRLLRPAFVYTVHDYLFEVSYSLDFDLVQKFFGQGIEAPGATQAQFDQQNSLFTLFTKYPVVFPAAVGIHLSDVVTCVSHHLARNIVEGNLNFTLREIVWDNLITKAQENHFFGVPNGVEHSPFRDELLEEHGLEVRHDPDESFLSKRLAAQELLIDLGILKPFHRGREIVLFVGRFQFIKGIDLCLKAVKTFRKHGVVMIVMGQTLGEYEFAYLLRKQGAVVIDSEELQSQIGSIVRLASTFAFVPSRSEAFGLVGAEGLTYGLPVISTGVGGMRDFLYEHPSEIVLATPEDDITKWPERNAYLFGVNDPEGMERAITQCVDDYRALDEEGKERFVWAMMETVRGLSWRDPRGPAYLYQIVYRLAQQARARRPTM